MSTPANPAQGWEDVAAEFLQYRSGIGRDVVTQWAANLPPRAPVLDIGCGFGGPYTQALLHGGLELYGIDASPTLLAEYQSRYPQVTTACEAAETSPLFNRSFDGILAIGLLFLLSPDAQITLLHKVGNALGHDGCLLFTAPWQVAEWDDLLTGRKSVSLGKAVYVDTLQQHGIALVDECSDEGENHHFSFWKSPA